MDYIKNTLGVCVDCKEWDKKNQMPYFIIERYEIQQVIIGKTKALFLYPKAELEQLNAIKKHIARIQKVENIPVVLILQSISRQRREYLIAAHIPFVVLEKQIYLPFLGVALQEIYNVEIPQVEQFQPSAQSLFFYYLYQKQNRLYTNDVVKALEFSAMTITRATRQLVQTGLFDVEKDGVQKVLIGRMTGKALFEKARPYLINPVRKSIFIKKPAEVTEFYSAGITALSQVSMINPPNVVCYAAGSNNLKGITGTKILVDAAEQVEIQVWKYDPAILSKEPIVDSLSLALSLKDDKDERVEEAVEELLENVWEE